MNSIPALDTRAAVGNISSFDSLAACDTALIYDKKDIVLRSVRFNGTKAPNNNRKLKDNAYASMGLRPFSSTQTNFESVYRRGLGLGLD